MTKKMHPEVDAFFRRVKLWKEEMEQLRMILLDCGLTESLKWSKPCYSYDSHNVVVIQGFKAYCALMFFKGYLVKDPKGLLVKTGAHTRVGRQARFTSVADIIKVEPAIKACVRDAIKLEKDEVKAEPPKPAPISVPTELEKKFKEDPSLKKAFAALTPGRQRAYLIYFSSAKQSATRLSRIENSINQILQGKGLRY